MVASGDQDKGTLFDAGEALRTREGGMCAAHVPYLKKVEGDVDNELFFSAKAIWKFESVTRSTATAVKVIQYI